MMEQGSVRNLEQIQENDADGRTPRGITLLLVALGGACIVFGGLALSGRRAAPLAQKVDPLGELVTQQQKGGHAASAVKATDLSTKDVTFPGILSDEGAPTTALAAVRGNSPRPTPNVTQGNAHGAGGNLGVAPLPPAPSNGSGNVSVTDVGAAEDIGAVGFTVRGSEPVDRAPIPAQNVLGASPVVTRPRDSLTRAASDAAESASAGATAAPAGHEGGYALQVSSFRTQGEADQFAGQLRARGHKSYVVEAHVAGRGTWYRVRVGPFPSQHAAASYRAGFEGREHVVPFIVPPSSK